MYAVDKGVPVMTHRIAATIAIILCWPVGFVSATVDQNTQRRLASLAVPFVPNAGQWDSRAAFAAHLSAGVLFVTRDGQLVYRFQGAASDQTEGLARAPEHGGARSALLRAEHPVNR